MASKEFSTFEAFWQAISPSIISRNCPTYHPCCRVWVGRFQKACRDSHIQVVSWRAALHPLSSPGTSVKELLRAHMLENQWGTPIHLDARCSAVATPAALNRALLNQEIPPTLQAFPYAFQFHTQLPVPTSPRSEPVPPPEQQPQNRWQSQEPQFRQPQQLQTIQIELKPSQPPPLPADLTDRLAAIQLGMAQHTDHFREYNHHLNLSSLELKSRFSDSEKAIQELSAQQIATKAELAAVSQRSALLENQLAQVQKVLSDLTRHLNPATADSVAVQAVKNEVASLQQKLARAEAARVGTFADAGSGRTRSPRVPPTVPAAAERLRPSGRPPGLAQAGCTAAEEGRTVPTPTEPGQQTGQAAQAGQRTLATAVLHPATLLIARTSTLPSCADFVAIVIAN